jgi:arylsulfatase A-like enzyme
MFNVLLITIDSLRPDFIGCYNKDILKEGFTPNIDKWAESAVIFKSVISQGPQTPMSFPAILSGQYACRYLDIYSGLSEKRKLISEILKSKGYNTSGFNPNPYISRYSHYDRGFDYFRDYLYDHTNNWLKKRALPIYVRLKILSEGPYVPAVKLNQDVFSWLQKDLRPFFLWVHHMDVHGPYISKKGWPLLNRVRASLLWHKSAAVYNHKLSQKEKDTLVRTYKEEIAYLDHHIKLLLDAVDYRNTIVIITADHGELLGEHDLFGHPFELYDELLKVPLIIKVPESVGITNSCIETTVRSIDIVPTILDLLSIKPDIAFDGKSLVPLMQGYLDGYTEPIFSEIWTKFLSVRFGKWKLIANYTKNEKQLFDLKKDYKEQNNLAQQEQSIVSELELLIKNHLLEINAPQKDIEECGFKPNEEIKTRLKALGYM